MPSIMPAAHRLRLLLPFCAALLGLLLFAACSADPTPTPTPTATPTPAPTATPTPAPTATPTPAPAEPPSLADLTLFSPARDVFAAFSDEENSCISGKVGEAAYQAMLAQPLAAVVQVPGQLEMVLECVAPEKAAELAIIGIGAVAGGFTDESAQCLRTLYTTAGVSNFAIAGSEDPQEILLGFRFFTCLTDEEAQALTQAQGIPMQFPPSALRCVDEHIGLEQFLPAMAGDLTQLPPDAMQVMQACNINVMPPG